MHADFNLNKDLAAEHGKFFARLLILLAALFLAVWATNAYSQDAHAGNKAQLIEVFELRGEVGAGMVEQVQRYVEAVNENQKVKGVVLVVDSPGGSALASAAIYEELAKIRVPVVGWCNNLCASGGYYVLTTPSVKWIGVRNETISGSIGVIMQTARFHRLLQWAMVDVETYKSGSLKDSGNPTRAAQDEEKKYLQSIIDELAAKFYAVVSKARPKITAWDNIKTGRIFIGQNIVNMGLADTVASKEDAIKKAKELSGAKLIFTREELKKMSKDADAGATYSLPPNLPNTFGDVPWLIETLKEIRSGESVKFEYRLPYKF